MSDLDFDLGNLSGGESAGSTAFTATLSSSSLHGEVLSQYHLTTATTPHVMVVMLENAGYSRTLGFSATNTCASSVTAGANTGAVATQLAPYLCSLAANNMYVHDTTTNGFVGFNHPSLPNYLALTTSSQDTCDGVTTTACGASYTTTRTNSPSAACIVSMGGTVDACVPNAYPTTGLSNTSIGGQLLAHSVPWTAYIESIPSACAKNVATNPYVRRHNPFVYTDDTLNNGCATHDIAYPGAAAFKTALTSSGAPDFVFVAPNLCDDMHGSNSAPCTDAQGRMPLSHRVTRG